MLLGSKAQSDVSLEQQNIDTSPRHAPGLYHDPSDFDVRSCPTCRTGISCIYMSAYAVQGPNLA